MFETYSCSGCVCLYQKINGSVWAVKFVNKTDFKRYQRSADGTLTKGVLKLEIRESRTRFSLAQRYNDPASQGLYPVSFRHGEHRDPISPRMVLDTAGLGPNILLNADEEEAQEAQEVEEVEEEENDEDVEEYYDILNTRPGGTYPLNCQNDCTSSDEPLLPVLDEQLILFTSGNYLGMVDASSIGPSCTEQKNYFQR